MDTKQEQKDEFELLKCIYGDDLNVISDDPIKFQVKLKYDIETEIFRFEIGENYPLEPFNLQYVSCEIFSKDQIDLIITDIKDFNLNNLGRAILFEAINLIQDKIAMLHQTIMIEKLNHQNFEKIKNDDLETEIMKKPTIVKYEERTGGTEVTVESFNNWKIKFEAEMKIDYNNFNQNCIYDSKKLSGKEFFEQSHEDMAYVEIEGEQFELDEKLLEENLTEFL